MTTEEIKNLLNDFQNIEWAHEKEEMTEEDKVLIESEEGFFYKACDIVCKTMANNYLYIINYNANNEEIILNYNPKNKNIWKRLGQNGSKTRLFPNLDGIKNIILNKKVYIIIFSNTKIEFNPKDGFKSKILLVNKETIGNCVINI